jgi:hypothetical protein
MRMKNLEKLRVSGTGNTMQLSIQLPRTPDGRVYRYSPNEDAHPRHFVLGDGGRAVEPDDKKRSRMKLQPGSTRTVCPYSGVIAADDEFTHPDDVKAALKIVQHKFAKDVTASFDQMLSEIAQKSSGFVSYKRGSHQEAPQPRFGRRDLMRLLVCDHCGRDYGVFAIALFCPDCGAPNISLHFAREVDLVGKQVELAEGLSKDQQELAYRLLGNAHEDVLTAFEATLKTLYRHGITVGSTPAPLSKSVGNDFQNIERGQGRFAELNIDPFKSLTDAETLKLGLNIQKRHVVGHNLSVADAKFAQTANDAKVGETVMLVGADVKEFAELCQKVIDWLDVWLGGQTPAASFVEDENAFTTKDARDGQEQLGELGPLATAIGAWICKSSAKGLPEPVDSEALVEAFTDSDSDQLGDAIAKLDIDGLITTSHAIGLHVPRVCSTDELFLTFDPVVLKTNPIVDAIGLTKLVLDGRESVGLKELHDESGLPLRQFNPAISMILAEVGDGRISLTIGEFDYPTQCFFLIAEDRVAIRRLTKRLEG